MYDYMIIGVVTLLIAGVAYVVTRPNKGKDKYDGNAVMTVEQLETLYKTHMAYAKRHPDMVRMYKSSYEYIDSTEATHKPDGIYSVVDRPFHPWRLSVDNPQVVTQEDYTRALKDYDKTIELYKKALAYKRRATIKRIRILKLRDKLFG